MTKKSGGRIGPAAAWLFSGSRSENHTHAGKDVKQQVQGREADCG